MCICWSSYWASVIREIFSVRISCRTYFVVSGGSLRRLDGVIDRSSRHASGAPHAASRRLGGRLRAALGLGRFVRARRDELVELLLHLVHLLELLLDLCLLLGFLKLVRFNLCSAPSTFC